MIYIGIDPSYSKTGVCFLDLENKIIYFDNISPEGTNETYADAANRSADITVGILKHINPAKEYGLIFEEPLLTSQRASRLGILSGILAVSFYSVPNIKKIYTVHPVVVSAINRPIINKHKIHKKKASRFVVDKVLEYLEAAGFEIIIQHKTTNKNGEPRKRAMSHDEAEAFIILTQILKVEGVLPEKYWTAFYNINKGFKKEYSINKLKDKGEIK